MLDLPEFNSITKKRFNTKIEFVNALQLCIVNKNKSETKTYKRKKAKRK